jgi:hypothetical protein
MHSHWVDRLFGQIAGSHHRVGVMPISIATTAPFLAAGKSRHVAIPRAINPKPSTRICLGIGDGSVHRQ